MRDVRITSLPTGAPPWRRAAWIALAILLAAAAVWWLYHRATGECRRRAGRVQHALSCGVGAHHNRRHQYHLCRARHRDAARDRHRAQPDQRADHPDRFSGRPDGEAGRSARHHRSAALSGGARAGRGHASEESLAAEAGAGRSRALSGPRQAGSIAQQTVDDQAHLVNQYIAQTKVDQGAVDAAKLNLAYCHVVAPINGRVGLRQVDIGNYVTANDASGLVVDDATAADHT